MNWLEQSMGAVARELPGATGVLNRYGLDFCCGGTEILASAAARKGINVDELTEALRQLTAQAGEQTNEWAGKDIEQLIEHILTRYHDVHRQQLPELRQLSARVELVHGGHPQCPVGLTDLLDTLEQELCAHMQKEECILFPMLARGITGMAVGPIRMMRAEHDDHGDALAELRRVTRDLTLPEGACNTWTALYTGLETLVQDLMAHIHLENNILFDRIDGQGGAAHG